MMKILMNHRWTQRGLGPQPKHGLGSSIEIMKRFLTGLTGFTGWKKSSLYFPRIL
jgi:hypothetical protein